MFNIDYINTITFEIINSNKEFPDMSRDNDILGFWLNGDIRKCVYAHDNKWFVDFINYERLEMPDAWAYIPKSLKNNL